MPGWLVATLLAVFAVHLLVFSRRARRTRQVRDGLLALTFGLLVLAFAVRLGAPGSRLLGIDVFLVLRVAAWMAAAASLAVLVAGRVKGASRNPPGGHKSGTGRESSH